jgi:hypothetical protein
MEVMSRASKPPMLRPITSTTVVRSTCSSKPPMRRPIACQPGDDGRDLLSRLCGGQYASGRARGADQLLSRLCDGQHWPCGRSGSPSLLSRLCGGQSFVSKNKRTTAGWPHNHPKTFISGEIGQPIDLILLSKNPVERSLRQADPILVVGPNPYLS